MSAQRRYTLGKRLGEIRTDEVVNLQALAQANVWLEKLLTEGRVNRRAATSSR